jgi:hypothetical protein
MAEHKQLQIRMSADLRRRFRLYALEHGTTMQELVNAYVQSLLTGNHAATAETRTPVQATIIRSTDVPTIVLPTPTRRLATPVAVPKTNKPQRFRSEPMPPSLPDDAFDAG